MSDIDIDQAKQCLESIAARDPEVATVLQALAANIDDIYERLETKSLGDAGPMLIQLRGGVTDPREDHEHPGHILFRFGWRWLGPEPMGCEWTRDDGKHRVVLHEALSITLRELAELADTTPPPPSTKPEH